jgi:hypothetical protein
MAHGQNAFCELAHTLRLDRLQHDCSSKSSKHELVALDAQNKYLCAVIGTLKRITTVQSVLPFFPPLRLLTRAILF